MYPDHSAYRAAWSKSFTEDPPVPLNIDIELVSFCNLACPFCAWGDNEDFRPMMQGLDFDGKPKRRFFDPLTVTRLIDECTKIGVPALKFNFRGESTLHPDFSEILAYTADKKVFFDIMVNTNGNCPPASINGLMRTTKVMVSLDSMIEETYDEMRAGGDLGKACETIRELIRRGHPNLWVRRVITKQNQSEPFAQNVHAMFGASVHVSDHYAFDRSDKQLMLETPDEGWGRQYCGYPSQRLVVTASGKVMACCVAWREETMVGLWPDQSLTQIWNSKAAQDLRQHLRGGAYSKAPDLCRNCTSYMSYQRKERENVQDKEAV
jgi:radical SAM protein with 4Fe4S-binding SPASM domain